PGGARAPRRGTSAGTGRCPSDLPVDEGAGRDEADLRGLRHALGRADHQEAAWADRIREPLVQALADVVGEVDDGLAAGDQVVRRTRERHPQEVADLEGHAALQLLRRAPRGAVRLEPALELRARRRARVLLREPPLTGARDHAHVDVRALDLDPRVRDAVAADGRERVRLGAVRAARAPRLDAAALGQLGDDVDREQAPLLRVAPELRDVDRDAVEELVELVGLRTQERQVLGQPGNAAPRGERPYPP